MRTEEVRSDIAIPIEFCLNTTNALIPLYLTLLEDFLV
jgi:hypothetical protein